MDMSPDVARELVFAFTDAAERDDDEGRDYAVEQIEDFLDDTDDDTSDDVLVALLDLPLDGTTLPLLNEVSGRLRRRGPGVVECLLAAAVGQGLPEVGLTDVVTVAGAVGALLEAATRNPDTPPRVENALAILDALPLDDLVLGLVEVLEGRGGDHLKRAASDALVEIGPAAVDELTMSLRDRDAGPWVVDTLDEIKARQSGTWQSVDDDAGDDDGSGDDEAAEDDAEGDEVDGTQATYPVADDETRGAVEDGAPIDTGTVPPAPGDPAASDTVPSVPDDPTALGTVPEKDSIDQGYQAFLERFKRETGQS